MCKLAEVHDNVLVFGFEVPSIVSDGMLHKYFVLVHCATNCRLAGLRTGLASEFGAEGAVCAHTFTALGKVNKLRREELGLPTHKVITRAEADENKWVAVYSDIGA